MLKRKEFLTALCVACIAVMSLSTLVYAATWTPEEMADWMYRVGRGKIWRTTYEVVNHIRPKVDDMQEKMGQGLVGEQIEGTHWTEVGPWNTLWLYPKPSNPKKVSFWIKLLSADGNNIRIIVWYERQYIDDTATRKFDWTFQDSQPRKKLIIDELPVAEQLEVKVRQTSGTPTYIYWHAIIEEL